MTAALILWALAATACAVAGWARASQRRRDYLAALALFGSLPRPVDKTPHQRGAETAKAKRLAASKAHRLALRSSMENANGG